MWRALGVLSTLLLLACAERPRELSAAKLPEPRAGEGASADRERSSCAERVKELRAEPPAPGAPDFERERREILGRARAEPVLWIREPRVTPDDAFDEPTRLVRRVVGQFSPLTRLERLKSRYRKDRATLRALVLREGYLYSADALEAHALVRELRLTDLFDEPEIWLERGATRHRLHRASVKNEVGGAETLYAFSDGELAGGAAPLILGDRVAIDAKDLAAPLHRDLRALQGRLGFDRARLVHLGESAIYAELRFEGRWVPALLEARGAELDLGCFDAAEEVRASVTRSIEAGAKRRAAVARLQRAVGQIVDEGLEFDRPRQAKDHLRDGQLRPLWEQAYRNGESRFYHGPGLYQVFDPSGRPSPPETCVCFVLDSFERASGTWYRPAGEPRQRLQGGLDFGTLGIENRVGVNAFYQFAADRPESFETWRFSTAERVPFGQRSRFFRWIGDNHERFRAGDLVAIHGPKADGHQHQHAILIEALDPVTGFPYALADQRNEPKRGSWESIMAEAPRRSFFFQIRLKDPLFLALAPPG